MPPEGLLSPEGLRLDGSRGELSVSKTPRKAVARKAPRKAVARKAPGKAVARGAPAKAGVS
jgi:hypothetical protein